MTAAEGEDLFRTQWGEIRNLRRDAEPDARDRAWRHLVTRYRPAFVGRAAAVLRRIGGGACSPDEAEDVVQHFLAECAAKGWLERADPARGTFRAFVFTALARCARDWVDQRRARKRAPGGVAPRSADALGEVIADEEGTAPDAAFQEDWARCLVAAAIARVRGRSARAADVLQGLLAAEGLGGAAAPLPPGTDAAEKALRHRARTMFAEALWEEVKETTTHPRELEEERRALHAFLARYLDPGEFPSFFGA